jgi:hypothetical protein
MVNYYFSTSDDIYDDGIIGRNMDVVALKNIRNNDIPIFFNNEQLGKFKYLSSYIAFRNVNSKILGYLNIPYFENKVDKQENLSTFVISLINIYTILILLSVIIAILISNKSNKFIIAFKG